VRAEGPWVAAAEGPPSAPHSVRCQHRGRTKVVRGVRGMQVGGILYAADKGSDLIADTHVIAACLPAEVARVVTADPDDTSGPGHTRSAG
jgi:hypothetical protein